MQRTSVLSSDGTGNPRRCAIQTPSGSIEAAASDAANILFGVLGMIIEETRITIVTHERCCILSAVGGVTHVLSNAIAAAFASMYARPRSILDWGDRLQRRTYRPMNTEKATPAASTNTAVLGTRAPIVNG